MEFILLIVIAFATESILEMVKQGVPYLKTLEEGFKKVGIFFILGFLLSFMFAWGFQADLLQMIIDTLKLDVTFTIPYVGIIFTAVITSGGSKGVHDWINKLMGNVTKEEE